MAYYLELETSLIVVAGVDALLVEGVVHLPPELELAEALGELAVGARLIVVLVPAPEQHQVVLLLAAVLDQRGHLALLRLQLGVLVEQLLLKAGHLLLGRQQFAVALLGRVLPLLRFLEIVLLLLVVGCIDALPPGTVLLHHLSLGGAVVNAVLVVGLPGPAGLPLELCLLQHLLAELLVVAGAVDGLLGVALERDVVLLVAVLGLGGRASGGLKTWSGAAGWLQTLRHC